MISKNLTAVLLSLVLFGMTACQKEFISDEQSVNGEVTADDATANDVLETAAPIHTPRQIAINSNVSGFYESLPARYRLTTKRYPLIVFIHGIGELGTGLSRLNCCGLPHHLYNKTFPAKFLVNGVYYSFIVVSPQFRVRPSAAQVQSVVDYAKNHYRVDPTRVYVTGLSMGGGSTWDFSAVYGQNAAAIVPVCGGTRPTTTLASKVASKNLPIWTISSTADRVVPIQWAKDWISWIDSRNTTYASKTKLTIYSTESHNATWARAFNPASRIDGKDIYEWMLMYKRGTSTSSPAPTPSTSTNGAPIARAGADQTIPVSWKYMPLLNGTRSTDADGWIKSFRWTKISGPSSYWFSAPSSGQTKANGLVAGTYVFRLTVTDNQGKISTDDVKVTMTSSTSTSTTSGAPIATAGPDQSIPLSWKYMPTLNATKSHDSDGGWIKSFKWTKVSGPSGSWYYPNSTSGQTKVEGLVAGTYVFRVTVTDNSGKTASDDVKITMTRN
jgi:pimeloyl-ACP methyl ester carboxylesterase